MTVLLYALVGCITLMIGIWIGIKGSETECEGEHHWGDAKEQWRKGRAKERVAGHVTLKVPVYSYCQHDGCNEKKRQHYNKYYINTDDIYDSRAAFWNDRHA